MLSVFIGGLFSDLFRAFSLFIRGQSLFLLFTFAFLLFTFYFKLMLKRYMHKRERHFAMLNDNRVVREFGWGTEFIKKTRTAKTRARFFSEYHKRSFGKQRRVFLSARNF